MYRALIQVLAFVEPLATIAARLRTIRDLVRFGASAFAEAGLCFGHGTDNALDEALALALHALRLDHSIERRWLESRLTEAEIERVFELFRRRIEERKPAAYLIGETWFAGLLFHVDERVVIPRSPFAELVRKRFQPWLESERVARILDLGCGSGCIGIACAYAFPDAVVDLVDCDDGALEVARDNVALHELAARVRVRKSDLFADLDARTYDLIVCNPPYVDAATYAGLPPEYAYEPRIGLQSGEDGLAHALAVLGEAAAHLADGGLLAIEVGEGRTRLEHRLPHLGLIWVELEHGGDGIAVISKSDLCLPGAFEAAA